MMWLYFVFFFGTQRLYTKYVVYVYIPNIHTTCYTLCKRVCVYVCIFIYTYMYMNDCFSVKHFCWVEWGWRVNEKKKYACSLDLICKPNADVVDRVGGIFKNLHTVRRICLRRRVLGTYAVSLQWKLDKNRKNTLCIRVYSEFSLVSGLEKNAQETNGAESSERSPVDVLAKLLVYIRKHLQTYMHCEL